MGFIDTSNLDGRNRHEQPNDRKIQPRPDPTHTMPHERSVKRELFGAILSTAVSLFGAVDLIGHPARTVHVLTIFVGGLGAGIGIARVIDRWRAERRERATSVVP